MTGYSPTSIRAASLFLLLTFFCGSAMSDSPTTLRKVPYLLYPGGPTTMQVLWQAPITGPSTIAWGTDAGCALGLAETAEYGTDHQHTIILRDLAPDTHYFYRVVFDGTEYAGNFRTAPPLGTPRVKFLAYGDTRSDPATHDMVAGQILQAIVADPELRSLIVFVGDLTGNGDSESVFDREFFSPAYPNIRRLMAGLPYQSCMGNHEDSGILFNKYFPYPYVGSRYWSFDYGPAHFLVVDQYESYAPGSAQFTWIRNDLETTTQPWRFVILHAPGWSAGGGHKNNKSVQQYLQPLFVQNGVSIVFGGHNHYYARAVVEASST